MSQSLFEKLFLKDEKNLLIQGLPSSIEKQFAKLSYAKNVTPLLKNKKIDFALVFALNETQLNGILKDVIPAMHEEGKLWVAYPKLTSKIVSDLNRDCSWSALKNCGFEGVQQVALDHVWSALWFKKTETIERKPAIPVDENGVAESGVDMKKRTVTPPEDLEKLFQKNKKASDFFNTLSFTNKKEYVEWIYNAKKEETRQNRLQQTIEKLSEGKKNPTQK